MTRLSAALRAAADEPHDLDLDAVHTRADRRRRHRTRARAGACALGALVVVAGIGLTAGAGDRGADVRAGEPEGPGLQEPTSEPTSSSTEAPTSESTTTSTEAPSTSSTAPEESTTTSTEVPTTEVPTTTAPAPSALHLEWDYAGDEQWRLGMSQCPDLTHWLDAEAIGSDGSTWAMREDYCGHNDGQRWEGEGTFSLAGAQSTLSGRMTSSAPMPTTGVPYSWTVEGGTGAYAGATGECIVTIHMTDAVFGSAHHEGTITCDLTLGGDAGAVVPESV